MSRVVRYLLERVTALDLNLMGRLGRRELDRATSYDSAIRHLWGPIASSVAGNRETLNPSVCLGGLEVEYVSASTVKVTAGALLTLNLFSVSETRPGTWSGKVENDDWVVPIGVLPIDTNVAPGSPIGGPLAADEWWVVYATVNEDAIETDSQRQVFNEGTGAFDSASAAKVKQNRLSLAITRQVASSGIPGIGGYPIAWIYVPSGATDLSGATIFDVRRIPNQDPGPNMVGGSWEVPFTGTGPASPTDTVWQGEAWARIRGERVRVASDTGMTLANLAEPGASWGTNGEGIVKLVWLYACKVRGLVPRPVRRGNSPWQYGLVTSNILGGGTSDGYVAEGALVLSPAPPRCGIFQTGGGSAGTTSTGLRTDLRPSRALTLPSSVSSGGLASYVYAGESVPVDDALCVGMLVQVNVSGGLPLLLGPLFCGPDGWLEGEGLSASALGQICTLSTSALPAASCDVSFFLQTITLSIPEGTAGRPPFEAIRVAMWGAADAADRIKLKRQGDGQSVFTTTGSPYNFATKVDRLLPRGSWAGYAVKVQAQSANISSLSPVVCGLKLPFGSPLVT